MNFPHKCAITLGKKKYLAVTLSFALTAQSYSFEFFMGDIEGSLDSQISMGSSWRMENQNSELTQGIDGIETNAENNNDGDERFDKGDAFSQIFKGSHDLQVGYDNYGGFVRGKYWYDRALEDSNNHNDSGYHDLAKFSGAEILDAFIYGEFEILDMPLDLRIGKQVVSWGESTFIRGGINQINPIDVSSFRRPGAEIKEGLIPVNMFFASVGVSENLSAETFYQLDYKETVTAGCGTYFSTNDYQPDGCDLVKTAAGEISRDIDGNRRPNSDGQFGVAFRYFSEVLDTEFGFYAMNVHGRSPTISGRKAIFDEAEVVSTLNGLTSNDLESTVGLMIQMTTNTGDYLQVAQAHGLTVTPQTYLAEYPEDQQLAGISFATNLGEIALSGEVTHKLDVPFQINAARLIGASLQADALYAYVFDAYGGSANQETANAAARDVVLAEHTSLGLDVIDAQDGSVLQGYRSFDVTQVQLTGIKLFDQVLGASRFAIIAEAGYTFAHDFNSDIEFYGDGNFDDTVTESSWGYRTRIVGEYNDVFSGVKLSPVLAWSHDVKGVAPTPGGNFVEGDKVLGFTLNAEYQNTYTGSVSYTQYSGGIINPLGDRDYASVSVGMQF